MKQTAVIEVKAKDLPWHCPPANSTLWNQHPRIFLDLSKGEQMCTYCGARYRLAAGEVVKHHHA